ncbi:hypothetical protein CUMW_164790, partial [Citrus unshiu]
MDSMHETVDLENSAMQEVFETLKCKCNREGLSTEESKILKFLGFMWNPLSWVMEAAAIMAIVLANGGENNAGAASAALMAHLAPKAKGPGDFVHSGSTCKQGEIQAVVIATSVHTFLGRAVHLVDTTNQVGHFQKARADIQEVHFLPFDPTGKRTALTYIDSEGKMHRVTKGAPEQILNLLHNKSEIGHRVNAVINKFAERGLRSLAVAYQEVPEGSKESSGSPWQFIGLIPLFDPPIHDSAETIRRALSLGLSVKMITGDQLAIAKETGRRLGMGTNMYPSSALLGQDRDESIVALPVDELIEKADGFAGVFPEHKYEIVKRLQARKHICGMIGNGINDAPALKKADIGIAVADAIDAARSAADIVLTEPGLNVIITAVLNSRAIFQRMKNYTIYAVSGAIIITISKDRVRPSPHPERWNLTEIFVTGSILGGYLAMMTVIFFWTAYKTDFFPRTFGVSSLNEKDVDDWRKLASAVYLQVSSISQANVFVTRARSWSYVECPVPFLALAFFVAQLIATLIAVYATWSFATIEGIGWGWAGVIWLYNIIFYIPLDFIKFFIRYVLSWKFWDLVTEQRIAFITKRDFRKEEHERRWAQEQRAPDGLPQCDTTMFSAQSSYGELSRIAEEAKRRAEIARLRELHTLKGHVESLIRLKGLDINPIPQSYSILNLVYNKSEMERRVNAVINKFAERGLRSLAVAYQENVPMEEVFETLKCSQEGLSTEAAEQRLSIFGYNKLQEKRLFYWKESKILKFLGFMWNPLSWVMEAAAIMAIENVPTEEVFETLKCGQEGLSTEAAEQRLSIFGYNKLEEKRLFYWKESKILKFLGFMWNPLSWVMEAAAIMAIVLANGGGKPPEWQDFTGIATLLLINSTVCFIQENNAGAASAALMARLAPKAKGPGDCVYSGSTCKQGEIQAVVIATGVRTFLGRAVHLVDTTNQVGHFQKARADIQEVHFLPFDPTGKRTALTYIDSEGKMHRVTKGAPEQILNLLHNKSEIGHRVNAVINKFAERGLRSLAEVPEGSKESSGSPWQFIGLIPLFDPPIHDSAETIRRALSLGLSVKMITGDQLAIAKETGRRLGMGTNMYPSSALSGQDRHESIVALPVDELIEKADGFAGVFPEHKYEIVKHLQARNHICGMIGNGVNDAPALKKADIGIAVADATDAARSAADIVLTEPGLNVIITSVLISRAIFQRMRNYTIYAVSITIHIGIAFTTKRDLRKEKRELLWAHTQRTLHGLQPPDTSMFSVRSSYGELSWMAEEARRRAEIARLREQHTLKGHVESLIRLKGLDINAIQQSYSKQYDGFKYYTATTCDTNH